MSDTFFTVSPHWGIYVLLYFFVGGIAGGCLFLAGLLHLFGRPVDRPTIRIAQYLALAGALLSAVLLTVDLTRPFRFWHMLLQSNTGAPMFKGWSPMSVGVWGLVAFAAVALLASLGALGETRPARWGRFAGLARGVPGAALAIVGGALGLFMAGYTGVLLSVTNRPIWADSNWIGVLFLLSGVSSAAATLFLLEPGRGGRMYPAPSESVAPSSGAVPTGDWLVALDRRILVLELAALVVFVWSLGSVARSWIGWNGLLLVVGVLGAGIIWPFVLQRPSREVRHASAAAVLVVVGGFLLRLLVLVSSARIETIVGEVAGR